MQLTNSSIINSLRFALVIVVSTIIGLFYTVEYGTVSVFFPAAGFAVVFYHLYGKQAILGMVIGFVSIIFAYQLVVVQLSFFSAIIITLSLLLAHIIEIILFEYIISKSRLEFRNLNELSIGIQFASTIALVSLIGALLPTVGIALVYGSNHHWTTWLQFANGDFLGILLFGSLYFYTYFRDKPMSFDSKSIVRGAFYIIVYSSILFLTLYEFGNNFVTLENFLIVIFVMYIYAAFSFSYRMIAFSNILFAISGYFLYLDTLQGNELQLQIVMVIIYITIISTIAIIVKNLLYEREQNYNELKLARNNLEQIIVSTNNLFNIENLLPHEAKEYSRQYLKDMFFLACDIYPKFDRSSCFIRQGQQVDYVAAKGYDVDFLESLNFIADSFIWTFFSPEIVNGRIDPSGFPSMIEYEKYMKEYGANKESIRFTIQVGEDLYGGMSFDVKEGSDYSFDDHDIQHFVSFQNVVNSYNQFGIINAQNNTLKDDIVRSSLRTLELYDSYTESHSDEVSELCLEIGRGLQMPDKDLRQLYWAALVHDIGKIGVPAEVLNKPGRLTVEEFDLVKQHPVHGYDILKKSSGLKDIARIVRHHHEWWDGTGYPDGLRTVEIPYASQIIQVCDAVSAMSHRRVYKKPMSEEEIVAELKKYKGKQFSPRVANYMLSYIETGRFKQFLERDSKEDK